MLYISLLRAINIGGNNIVKMDILKEVYQSLGLKNIKSYLQTGNVAFETDEQNVFQLESMIEDGIGKRFGFRPKVIIRTLEELREVVAKTPFNDGKERLPNRLLVMFLAEQPTNEAKAQLAQINTSLEELHLIGKELYLYYPESVANSKLNTNAIEKKLKLCGTARNWNTVVKLVEIGQSY